MSNSRHINRRDFLANAAKGMLAAPAALALSCTGLPVRRPAGTRRPNIIFILADDLGYGDVGCYGQRLIRTPAIDRLAAEGLRFTQCYSGSTVCAPSRCCLMTGYHSGHGYVRGNGSPLGENKVSLRPEDVTVAEVLKDAGYATGIVGKWGLGQPETTGVPTRQGFDYWFGYLDQVHAHEYYTDYLWRNEQKVELKGNLGGKQGEYSNDLFDREALDFVRRQKDKPFFLYLPFTIPHGKYQVPSLEPYAGESWTVQQKTYAAMITRLDGYIGHLMALLKSSGLDENTIVFFSSDNGPAGQGEQWTMFKGSGPLRGIKRDLYDGGIRVPMIARWPGHIAPGTQSDQVWAFWDFLPTAAELAGARPPEGIDGISMAPALLGKPQRSHEFLYWEFHERGFMQAVRMGDWKAVRYGAKEPLELYNLKSDLSEKDNVAAQHPEIVVKIEKYLETARTDSPYWFPKDRKPAPKAAAKKKAQPAKRAQK